MFWLPWSSSNAPQPEFLVGSSLQTTACSAVSLGLASFLPRLQTHLGSFPTQRNTCPFLRKDPACLPPPVHRWRRKGCRDLRSPPCAGTAGPPGPSPARSSQVVRKAPQLPLFCNRDIASKKERKEPKLSSIHPDTWEGVSGAWLKPHPCCTCYRALATPGFENRHP